jgi:hypothetical protein
LFSSDKRKSSENRPFAQIAKIGILAQSSLRPICNLAAKTPRSFHTGAVTGCL